VDTIGDLDQFVAQFQRPRDNCGEIEDVAARAGSPRARTGDLARSLRGQDLFDDFAQYGLA
jgi:hypothetical protein